MSVVFVIKARLVITISIVIKQILKDGSEIIDMSSNKSIKTLIKCNSGTEKIIIYSERKYIHIKWEPVIKEFIAYMPNGSFEFYIPNGEALRGFKPDIFQMDSYIEIREARSSDISQYRNLALNPLDSRVASEVTAPDAPEWSNPTESQAIKSDKIELFPHVYANRVTRNEGCFYARNAIDGVSTPDGHGDYPYHSWGGAVHEDLTFMVYFGRLVVVDRIGLCLRSDYKMYEPEKEHDTYWHTAQIELSDGYCVEINLQKLAETQYFELGEHTTTYLKLSRLDPLQHDNSQNFAALNQIEVWGRG